MSSGAIDLFSFAAGKVEALDRCHLTACWIGGVLAILFFLLSCSLETKKTGSMRYSRVGFGVKYFGFQHLDRCLFLLIFLRGGVLPF